jgi:signal transduction histidine kinase
MSARVETGVQSFQTGELLQLLSPTLLALSKANTVEDLALATLESLQKILSFDSTGFYFFDPSMGRMRLLTAIGLSEEERKIAEATALDRHPGWVIRTARPWLEQGVQGEVLPDGSTAMQDPKAPPHLARLKARLYQPILSEGKAIGAIGVVSREAGVYSQVHQDTLGFIAGVVAISHKRIIASVETRQSLTRLVQLIDSLRSGVLLEDQNRRVLHLNQEFCGIFRLPVPPAALVGMDCRAGVRDFMPYFKDPEAFAARIEEIQRELEPATDDRLELLDGRTLLRDYIPIFTGEQYQGCLWKYEDVTKKLEAEKQTRLTQELLEQERARSQHSAKMVSLGEMAGGIAHEVNTPLAVIQTVAEQLAETVEEAAVENPASLMEPEFREFIRSQTQTLRATVDRIAKIVRGMRAFARDGSKDPMARVTLHSIVEDSLALCSENLKLLGIRVEVTGLDPERTILARSTELTQVFLNLLNNSRDALKDLSEPTSRWIRIEVKDQGPARELEVRVQDGGPGVPEGIRDRLFQPFFTTKAPGEGTGLGLGISRQIVEAHGGTLNLVQFPPTPTTFVLTLPG